MAAAKLVTRCPACRTAFRLVADQLRLRQGLVRCGQCDTVFDAREHLIEVPAAPATGKPEASTPAPAFTPPAAVTMAAALAHAEQTQASARAHDEAAPFDPGFDPGYEVPALDSPTTMMSETETEPESVAGEAHAEERAEAEDDAVEEAEAEEQAQEQAVAQDAAEIEVSLTEPPVPWPTLDHAAFDDEAPHQAIQQTTSPATHSSLDPAAAFAPKSPTGMPPYGAYSAKASWPPLKPADTPPPRAAATVDHPPPAEHEASDAMAAEAAELASRDEDANTEYAAVDQIGIPADLDDGVARPADNAALPLPAEPVPSASGFLRAADPADPEADAWAAQAKAVIENDLGVTPRDGTLDAVARETTTRHWLREDTSAAPATGPTFAPDFLRHARGREQPRASQTKVALPGSKRTWMRAAVVVLALGVLVQGTYLARSQIAGSLPVLRPILEAACAPFHCEVPPWRDLDALRIDSSQLQKQDEASDVYQLAVTLRNQGRATTALPAIELVMTDLQDQLLLRRVLLPTEYLDPSQRGFSATGMRAGSELPVRVRFRTQQSAANYRVLIFYP